MRVAVSLVQSVKINNWDLRKQVLVFPQKNPPFLVKQKTHKNVLIFAEWRNYKFSIILTNIRNDFLTNIQYCIAWFCVATSNLKLLLICKVWNNALQSWEACELLFLAMACFLSFRPFWWHLFTKQIYTFSPNKFKFRLMYCNIDRSKHLLQS